jgi:putative DNA primase/helicase
MGAREKKPLSEVLDTPPFELGPRFDVQPDGVVYIGVKRDRETGGMIELPPVWLCDPVEILGCGTDGAGRQHRVLRWKRQGNREVICMAIPNAEIGERDGWARLRNGGLTLATERSALTKLAFWLQKGGPDEWFDIVTMPGWQHGAYVLPNGEIIGTPISKMHFNGSEKDSSAFRTAGTLDDWKNHVGRLAKGNPLVIASVACALAGPLLELIGSRDGIGLHLYTLTSSGKSTCGDTGASVWGNPERTMRTWDGTTLSFSNAAETRNDMLLYLDEIGAGDARKIGPAIYGMLNGSSRMQGARDGGNRESRSWLVSLISTGEVGMSQYQIEGGQKPRGGQEIRLLDIPADSGKYRAFDCIHELPDGEVFANTLTSAARANYGTLGRAFVTWLIEHRAEAVDWVKSAQDMMLAAVPEKAAAPVRRATRKFAVLLAAVEMASHADLTGWSTEEASEGVMATWHRWLAAFGLEDRDDARLVDQAEAALQSHQYSRFLLLPLSASGDEKPIHNLMGYRRFEPNGDLVFLVLPGAFKSEVVVGYEVRRACEVLHKAGMLDRPTGRNGWTTNGGRGIGQIYKMRPLKADDEASAA